MSDLRDRIAATGGPRLLALYDADVAASAERRRVRRTTRDRRARLVAEIAALEARAAAWDAFFRWQIEQTTDERERDRLFADWAVGRTSGPSRLARLRSELARLDEAAVEP